MCKVPHLNSQRDKVCSKLSVKEIGIRTQIPAHVIRLLSHLTAPSARAHGTVANGLIINIRDVHHPADRVAPYLAHHTLQQIRKHKGTHVPKMGHIVHGRTTRVDAHRRWVKGRKRFNSFCEGVVEGKHVQK